MESLRGPVPHVVGSGSQPCPPPPMSHCLPEGNYAKQRMGLDTVCYQDGAEWKSGPEGPLPETSPESVCAEEERVCG